MLRVGFYSSLCSYLQYILIVLSTKNESPSWQRARDNESEGEAANEEAARRVRAVLWRWSCAIVTSDSILIRIHAGWITEGTKEG